MNGKNFPLEYKTAVAIDPVMIQNILVRRALWKRYSLRLPWYRKLTHYKFLVHGCMLLSLGFARYGHGVPWYHWPVFHLAGVVSVVELKQSSVMQRLLIGWMPTAIR